jgi:TRAP-type C4-dicarboxylate transport system permease small subunit
MRSGKGLCPAGHPFTFTAQRMNMLNLFDQFLNRITTLVKCVMLVQASIIFIIICTAVFTRYILSYVPSWSEEVPRYLLVWISYLGAALAVNYMEHISFDFFFNLMPIRLRQVGHLILNGLIAAVGVIMLVFGIGLIRHFGDDLMESVPVKNFWLYLVMPISGGLIILYSIRQTWKGILGFGKQENMSSSDSDVIPI